MTSSRPYLLRAIYDWLTDNELTPYVLVDAHMPHVSVPQNYVEDGKIILNISPNAVSNLVMNNECVEFDARFSGISKHIYVPIPAINAIYAYENGRGMVFSEEDDQDTDSGGDNSGGDDDSTPPPKSTGRGHLKIVK